MVQSPWVVLVAGAIGAVIGLFAPIVSGAFTRAGANRDAQRSVAAEILELLSNPQPIDNLLGGAHSPARRRLYVLGIRLRDQAAREACETLVRAAGQPGVTEDELYEPWQATLAEVSRVYRR